MTSTLTSTLVFVSTLVLHVCAHSYYDTVPPGAPLGRLTDAAARLPYQQKYGGGLVPSSTLLHREACHAAVQSGLGCEVGQGSAYGSSGWTAPIDTASHVPTPRDEPARLPRTKRNTGHNNNDKDTGTNHTIFLLPHSHCDVGWLWTVGGYFNMTVVHILDSVVADLAMNPTHKFIWSEMKWVR